MTSSLQRGMSIIVFFSRFCINSQFLVEHMVFLLHDPVDIGRFFQKLSDITKANAFVPFSDGKMPLLNFLYRWCGSGAGIPDDNYGFCFVSVPVYFQF